MPEECGPAASERGRKGTSIDGCYEIVESLGRHHGIDVARAVEVATGRPVLIRRVLRRTDYRDGSYTSPLAQEYRALSLLSHPSVPRPLHFSVDAGGMESLVVERDPDLIDIRAWVRRGTPAIPIVVARLGDLLSVLDYVHGRGLVHCGIGPSSILVRPDDSPQDETMLQVRDFHLSRWFSPDAWPSTPSDRFFSPPEHRTVSSPSPRFDLYSVGALAVYVLSGGREHDHVHTAAPADLLSQIPQSLPPELRQLLEWMLAPHESARPSRVAELRRQLVAIGCSAFAQTAIAVREQEACGIVPRRSLTGAFESALDAAEVFSGHVLVLVGPDGSGKTTALRLVRVESRARGLVCLAATHRDEQTGQVTLTDDFRALARGVHRDRDASGSLRGGWRSGGAVAEVGGLLRRTAETPRATVCLADDVDDLALEDFDVLLRAAVRREAEQSPVLIVVSCREIPRSLSRGQVVLPARWLAAFPRDSGSFPCSFEVHPLGSMSTREVASMVADLTGWSASPQLADCIAAKADNSPLFARMLTAHLATSGNLAHSSTGLISTPGCLARLAARGSIGALLREGMGVLEGDELRVAEAVALGPGLTLGVLSKITGLSGDAVRHALRNLARKGLVQPADASDEIRYTHTVMREAVYEAIKVPDRPLLHHRVVDALLDEQTRTGGSQRSQALAWHLYRSEEPLAAVPYAVESVADLARAGRFEELAHFLSMIEELASTGVADLNGVVASLLKAAECCWSHGCPSLAARVCEMALLLERSSGAPETATLIELYWILGRSSTLSGDPVSAARAFDRALEIATAAGQAIWLATTYSGLCMVHQMRGDLQESVRLARASVALLEDAGDPDLLSFTHNALGNALLAVCSWEEALVWYQQAAEWAEHAEDRARLSTTLGNMGLTHLNLGDWDLAEEYLERSLALARELGHAYSMELGYGNTGFLLTRRGALGEAGDSLHEAIALAQTCGDEWGLAVVLSNLGELEQLRGNVVVALEHYARSEQLMARVGCVDDLPELLRRRATSLLRLGRHAEALDSATRARGMASEMGNILEGANSSRVLAEIASSQGRGDEAARLCEEAIEKLEGIGAKYELGLALAARGRIGLAVGDSEEGGRFLKRAEQIFVELGARRDARIVQEELTQIDSGSIVPPSGLPEERQRLASLYKSSRSLAAAGSVESLLQELADISAANVHADTAAAVLLLPPDAATAAPSTICELRESPESLYSLVSSVLAERPEGDAAAVIRERSSGAGPLSRAKGIKCCVVAPMVAGGCTVGALYLDYRRRDGEFSDQDTRFLEALAAQGATAIENMQLRGRLEDEVEYLRWEVDGRCSFSNIIGQSLEMQRLYSVLQKVARSSVTVLIEGESGTGKELVARALHYDGPRKKARFVAQNCAALPEQLLESELFGHVRGAFTGALRDKTGLFEAADGGTFFLDEIADMPPSLQVKLLRVLQDGEVRRVGATDPTSVDVRIIAATNKSLEDEVKSGRFREDLYYRLNVVRLVMPPLRDRRDDIPLLAQHFLNKVSAGMDRPQTGFSDAAMDLLINYDWPGNVRELENEIERAVALSEPGAGITARVLSDRIRSVQVIVRPPRPGDRTSLKDLIDDVEKRVILQVLNEHNWNKSRTAEALGLSRQGLLKKIARLGLRPEEE